MIAAFRRLFGRTEEPVTRMTRDEALAAAADAASAAGMDKELTMTMVRKDGERLLWMVGTPTVGSGWTVEIDDATGAAGPLRMWGIR